MYQMNKEEKLMSVTFFNRADFQYHGGYLMYTGEYPSRPVYEAGPNVHPNNVGRGRDLFIARFKYNRRGVVTKANFLTELIKNHTVESYSKAIEENWAPVQILENVNKAWMPRIQQAWDKRRAADIMKPMMRWNAGGRKPF
jgi:hypothetical protein|tara:strand:+ start:1065 stop:1487 length:423 start_codon:yes stop_codon:yes gene_type:complete